MDNKCKDCIYFKKYEKNKIFGFCTNDESQRKSKKLRSELSNLPYGYGASVGMSMIFDNIKTIDDAINEAMIDMQSDKETYR